MLIVDKRKRIMVDIIVVVPNLILFLSAGRTNLLCYKHKKKIKIKIELYIKVELYIKIELYIKVELSLSLWGGGGRGGGG